MCIIWAISKTIGTAVMISQSLHLQALMSRQRFEKFTRYLKINSPHEEVDDQHFWHKVEPLSSSFREASKEILHLGDTINIDENL
jgi:hypothetical protein